MLRVRPVRLRATLPRSSLRACRFGPSRAGRPALDGFQLRSSGPFASVASKSSPATFPGTPGQRLASGGIWRLAGALPGSVASRLTSHSSRGRFAARLNSGVRLQRRRSWRPGGKSRSPLGVCRHDVALPGNFQISRHLLQKRCDAGAAKRALRRQRYTAFPLDAAP